MHRFNRGETDGSSHRWLAQISIVDYNRTRMKKTLRIILGVILILIGLTALITPFTPGSWLAVIGLELVGLRLLVQRQFLSLLPVKTRTKVETWINRLTENRWFRRFRSKQESDAKAKDPTGLG